MRILTLPAAYRDRSSTNSACREWRIHVEIFDGSEPMTPGEVGVEARAPHLAEGDANTGPLVSFARGGGAAHWKASVLVCCSQPIRDVVIDL